MLYVKKGIMRLNVIQFITQHTIIAWAADFSYFAYYYPFPSVIYIYSHVMRPAFLYIIFVMLYTIMYFAL